MTVTIKTRDALLCDAVVFDEIEYDAVVELIEDTLFDLGDGDDYEDKANRVAMLTSALEKIKQAKYKL